MNYLLLIRRYAPFNTFGGGFEGDNRSKGTASPFATSRTVGAIIFNEKGIDSFNGFSDGSRFLGFGVHVSKLIDRKYAYVEANILKQHIFENGIEFSVHTSGSNPLVQIVSPDIDTFVDAKISFSSTSLDMKVRVRGDMFPNAEIVLVEEGHPDSSSAKSSILLFDYHTSKGRNTGPMKDLWGSSDTNELGSFTMNIPISNGKILSCVPAVTIKGT